jgi:hypothetical protein
MVSGGIAQPRDTDVPLGARGLGHEAFQHQGHRERHDAQEHTGDAAEEHEVTEQEREQRRDADSQQQCDPGEAVSCTEIEGQDSIAISGDAEERGLAKRERSAIAPDQAKAKCYENPDEEVDRVADRVAVAEQRVCQRYREREAKSRPEGRAAT